MTGIFAAAAIICGLGWLKNAISLRAVLMYMLTHQYTPPTGDEMKVWCEKAVRMMFGIKS